MQQSSLWNQLFIEHILKAQSVLLLPLLELRPIRCGLCRKYIKHNFLPFNNDVLFPPSYSQVYCLHNFWNLFAKMHLLNSRLQLTGNRFWEKVIFFISALRNLSSKNNVACLYVAQSLYRINGIPKTIYRIAGHLG